MIRDIPISLHWAKKLWLAPAPVKSSLVTRREGEEGVSSGSEYPHKLRYLAPVERLPFLTNTIRLKF